MSDLSKTVGSAIFLDGVSLTLEQVAAVARRDVSGVFPHVCLAPEAESKMNASRSRVDEWVSDEKLRYGINTGLGGNHDLRIAFGEIEKLQEKMILSHAAGVGDPLPEEVVRAMILLRANALAQGFSGIRVEVVQRLIEMLNKEVCPYVPSQGSVGSSGDLAPLAHLILPLLDIKDGGSGEAFYRGQRLSGNEAMIRAGVTQVRLQAKEGLALINGTQMMTAIGSLVMIDAWNLAKAADVAGAMSLESLKGKSSPFIKEAQDLRPFRGQEVCAANIRTLIAGSGLIDRHDKDTGQQVQDAYSLRCMPQVHGASRDAFQFVTQVLAVEINSVTDNPLIFPDRQDPVEAGNFHGQPVALAMDFLTLALAEIGSISERRVAYLLDRQRNRGLPAFLVRNAGLNSGMMVPHYTAAALASENKTLIHPASGDSIPTSANQEDHNSMGSIAARHARQVLENVERIVAIELLCAAQAIEFRQETAGIGTKAACDAIRVRVPSLDEDRQLSKDIEKIHELVHGGCLIREVEDALLKGGNNALR